MTIPSGATPTTLGGGTDEPSDWVYPASRATREPAALWLPTSHDVTGDVG